MEYVVNKDLINSDEYVKKFSGITEFSKGDELVAHYARQAVLDNDGLATEDVYFLNAKNGKLINHYKLGDLGGDIVISQCYKNDIIVLHNHPNNAPLSFSDFMAMNSVTQIKTMIAAAHSGKIYVLCADNNSLRIDSDDEKELNFLSLYWRRLFRNFKCSFKTLKEITKDWGWRYYVK